MGKQTRRTTKHRTRKATGRPRPASRTPSRRPQAGCSRGRLFEALINAFPDTALIVDRDGKILSCNNAALKKMEKANLNPERHALFDVFPHINPAHWRKMFLQYSEARKPFHYERHTEGQYFFHHIHPVINRRGDIEFIVVFVQDITEYRHAENALQESEQKYRELVENISDTIYAMNEEGVVIYVNPALEAFIGFPPEEVLGRSIQDFLHPADAALVSSDPEGFLAGTRPQKEYRFMHRDGGVRWGRLSSHPVRYKDEVIGYQGVIADVTQTKTFNINLLKIVQENILSSLASSFTAEIGVPLRRARERLLARNAQSGADAGIDDNLRDLMHDLEGISVYLKNFTAFTPGEDGEHAPADVNSLLENATVLLKREFEKAGAECRCSLARGLESVAADPFSLIQVFVNLFVFSLQTMPKSGRGGGRLTVATAMEKDKVVVDIRDNGAGLSQDLLDHLSDPFSVQKNRKGAGTGLAIALQLVETQGGSFLIIPEKETGGLHVRIAFPAVIQTI